MVIKLKWLYKIKRFQRRLIVIKSNYRKDTDSVG